MSQDGLYDYLAHQDCLPREESSEEIVEQVREYIGDGDPFQVLLRDEFMRRKLNLHARAL
jgi:hypothetical protein